MAWATWRDTGTVSLNQEPGRRTLRSVLVSGITLNLLNPKLTIFFFAFLPQFVPAGGGSLPAMLGLSGVFMVMTFVTFVGYGVCAAAVRDRVLARPRVLERVRKAFALGFVGLGARLAVEQR